MPVIDVCYCAVSYLVLPLHRYGCEFRVFLVERKETAKKPWSLFYLAFSSWVALSSFLKEDGVVLTDASL